MQTNQFERYRYLADLQIDPDLQTVHSRDGQRVQLRRKEFQLFQYLANNVNSVISKFAILDLIWEMGSFVGSNTLDVHLSSLRKKIRQISNCLRIDTVRGVGYRLVSS